MAKAKASTGATKVRLLMECQYGKPDDVVELSEAELAVAIAVGFADSSPEAVAYAESLKG